MDIIPTEKAILDYLYSRLEVQNIRTYQILYECDQSKERHRKWFLIDLTDQKWHSLQQIMKADEFEDWVLETLEEKTYTSEKFAGSLWFRMLVKRNKEVSNEKRLYLCRAEAVCNCRKTVCIFISSALSPKV